MIWLTLISIVLSAVALTLLLPSISDLLSIAAIGLGRGRRPVERAEGSPPWRLLFMVPAHDEEQLIERCVRSLMKLDYPAELRSVLVVADNCTDRTSEIARAAGAGCIERDEPELRGKPHAIRWALERCDLEAHDALIILDGDTMVDPGYGYAMSRVDALPDKAAQAYNGISNPDENALTRMSFVLSEVYYRFMYPLRQRANLNPPLTGAGICIGAAVLRKFGWPALSLSEDVEMFALLTLEGVRTECVAQARVYSHEEASVRTAGTQRQRWRAGRLAILFRLGPIVIFGSGISARQRLDLIADLVSPGPAVGLGVVTLLAPAAFLLPIPASTWIGLALLASLVRPAVYTALTIAAQPDPGRVLRSFLYLPVYTGWRLFTELKTLTRRGDGRWIRTERQRVEPNE